MRSWLRKGRKVKSLVGVIICIEFLLIFYTIFIPLIYSQVVELDCSKYKPARVVYTYIAMEMPLSIPCDFYGDVNNDGWIDVDDVELLADYLGLTDNFLTESDFILKLTEFGLNIDEFKRRGDVDLDGEIDMDDGRLLRDYFDNPAKIFPACDNRVSNPPKKENRGLISITFGSKKETINLKLNLETFWIQQLTPGSSIEIKGKEIFVKPTFFSTTFIIHTPENKIKLDVQKGKEIEVERFDEPDKLFLSFAYAGIENQYRDVTDIQTIGEMNDLSGGLVQYILQDLYTSVPSSANIKVSDKIQTYKILTSGSVEKISSDLDFDKSILELKKNWKVDGEKALLLTKVESPNIISAVLDISSFVKNYGNKGILPFDDINFNIAFKKFLSENNLAYFGDSVHSKIDDDLNPSIEDFDFNFGYFKSKSISRSAHPYIRVVLFNPLKGNYKIFLFDVQKSIKSSSGSNEEKLSSYISSVKVSTNPQEKYVELENILFKIFSYDWFVDAIWLSTKNLETFQDYIGARITQLNNRYEKKEYIFGDSYIELSPKVSESDKNTLTTEVKELLTQLEKAQQELMEAIKDYHRIYYLYEDLLSLDEDFGEKDLKNFLEKDIQKFLDESKEFLNSLSKILNKYWIGKIKISRENYDVNYKISEIRFKTFFSYQKGAFNILIKNKHLLNVDLIGRRLEILIVNTPKLEEITTTVSRNSIELETLNRASNSRFKGILENKNLKMTRWYFFGYLQMMGPSFIEYGKKIDSFFFVAAGIVFEINSLIQGVKVIVSIISSLINFIKLIIGFNGIYKIAITGIISFGLSFSFSFLITLIVNAILDKFWCLIFDNTSKSCGCSINPQYQRARLVLEKTTVNQGDTLGYLVYGMQHCQPSFPNMNNAFLIESSTGQQIGFGENAEFCTFDNGFCCTGRVKVDLNPGTYEVKAMTNNMFPVYSETQPLTVLGTPHYFEDVHLVVMGRSCYLHVKLVTTLDQNIIFKYYITNQSGKIKGNLENAYLSTKAEKGHEYDIPLECPNPSQGETYYAIWAAYKENDLRTPVAMSLPPFAGYLR